MASKLDWAINVFGVSSALVMLGLGLASEGTNQIVLFVFAMISGVLSLVEMQGLRKNKFKGSERIVKHMTHMMAGTIATVTAVAVVNIRGVQPGWLVWFAPSMLIVPIIIYWTLRLRRSY